ncbi:MAG: heme exporter protein CcmD [Nitrospinota bacterium]
MGYVVAAYAVTLIALGYYGWTLWERRSRLRRQLGGAQAPREGRR